jgi:3-hydroxyisobutyrate dehydrogenase
MSEPIGVVGLGHMGGPIARNLAKAGHRVFGFDIDPTAAQAVAGDGVRTDVAVEDAVTSVPVWLLVLPNEAALRSVAAHLLGLLPAGACLVICSSVDAAVVHDIGTAAQSAGVAVCDAALARGVPAARDGTLLVYCGGSDTTVERVLPILHAMARDVVHVGPLGSGETAKMLNNLLLWSTVAAVTETMTLAAELGQDQKAILEALRLGSGKSWVLDTWERPRPMPDLDEDLVRILRIAGTHDLEMPLTHAVQRLMTGVKREKAAWLQGTGTERSMAEFLRACRPGPGSDPGRHE